MMFSGQTGSLAFNDWIDELVNSVNHKRYKGKKLRRNPEFILKVLEEAYGHPLLW